MGVIRGHVVHTGVALVALFTPAMVAIQPATAAALPAAAVSPSAVAGGVQIGSVTLRHCDLGLDAPTWCGSISVPLDRTDPKAASIRIGFGWRPASGPPTGGTVVAQEGGPGYPSTGTAPDYAQMLGGLLTDHNLLVVDARGTGRSTPIDCEPLQSLDPVTPTARFEGAVAACGAQLNHTFRSTHGGYVHASDLFTTANSAADLAAVLHALRQGPVELYGDSYGTYFAQSFLARYPMLLRGVVMDSAYEARDLDPWYVTTVTTARSAFDAVCGQAAACRTATAGQGSPWQRIGTLTEQLRRHAITGRAPGVDGTLIGVRVDVTALVNMVNDAGYDADVYRQLDAAARAFLQHRDPTPLLRLYAQDIGYDYSDYQAAADYYSDGLYMAVACTDYPQLFDMRAGQAARRRELAASISALPASTFAPFTTREWISVLPYTETYTGCLSWPEPTHPDNPPVPPTASMDATNVPVLILNGALDSLTPAAGGAHIHRQIGSAATSVVVPGMVHLVGLDDRYGCGASLVQQFLRQPSGRLNTSCTARVPEVHAVGVFPDQLSQAQPARGSAPATVLREATVALDAIGDAATRFNYIDGYDDVGLRGGRVTYTTDDGADIIAALHAVHWTNDTTVTGTLHSDPTALAVNGTVTLTARSGASRTFTVCWDTTGLHTQARIRTGPFTLTAPAP